jgi:hypothetical protein
MSGLCISIGLSKAEAVGPMAAPAQPMPQFLELAGGVVEIATGPDLLTLIISGGTPYDGTHVIHPADLDIGPVNLVLPAISGTAGVSETLTRFPGLWIYNPTLGIPTITNQWLADGLPISGATAASYTVAEGDAGKSLSLRETVSQGTAAPMADSQPIDIPSAGVPVFLLIGQSNMLGKATYDGLGPWPTGTFEWTSGGLVDRSGSTMQLGAADAGTMGMALEFATRWIAADGGEVIFIQAAIGGTGFVDNRWNPGADLYENAVALTNACLAADARHHLAGIFFVQGGKDSDTAAAADAYHDRLYAMVTGLRTDIAGATDVPLVLSGTTTTNNLSYKWSGQVDSAQELLFQRVDRVAHVNTDGLTFLDSPPLHWNAPALRTVGQRFFDTFRAGVNSTAKARTGAPAVVAVGHNFAAATGTATTIPTTVSAAAGQDVYVVLASRGNGEVTGVTIGGQAAIEVYGQVDYNLAVPANGLDGLFIFKVTAAAAMTNPAVGVQHMAAGVRIGCAAFVVSGASVDRVKAETDFAVNSTAITVTEVFTTDKTALVIAAGMFSSGTSGWDNETLANVVVSTGVDPANLTNNWTVSYQTLGAGDSVSAAARANCGTTATNYGSLFVALLIE